MVKRFDKYFKVLVLIICIVLVFFIGSIFLFFNMTIDDIYEKYDLEIPMGSFDAKYGGGERYLYNDEVRVDTIYYTKNVDYLIKKYDFENVEFNSEIYNDLKEKIIDNLNSENKKQVEEYLSNDFQTGYYKYVENENGKLLLIYVKNEQTIYCIENRIIK